VFSGAEKFSKKKQKVQNILKIFFKISNFQKKKQKKRTMISCGRHLEIWMEKLDWMKKTMSHMWLDGCLSADGQKTRVYENPMSQRWMFPRTSGRKAFWRFGWKN
jgi:hypothetical protein